MLECFILEAPAACSPSIPDAWCKLREETFSAPFFGCDEAKLYLHARRKGRRQGTAQHDSSGASRRAHNAESSHAAAGVATQPRARLLLTPIVHIIFGATKKTHIHSTSFSAAKRRSICSETACACCSTASHCSAQNDTAFESSSTNALSSSQAAGLSANSRRPYSARSCDASPSLQTGGAHEGP